MTKPPEGLAALPTFRQELYGTVLGLRRDSLFEVLDAALSAEQPTSLVRLSVQAAFRRRWPSACDALSDGTVDAEALRRVCVGTAATLPAPDVGQRELWAVDGTSYPRADAATSAERTWERRAVAGARQAPLVPAWAYQWLVALPQPGTSWLLPLDVRRRGPAAGSPTDLLLAQLQAVLADRAPAAPRPVVVADSGYSAGQLARAAQGRDGHGGLAADLLVRLAKRRTLYGAPGPYAGMGAPRKHGPKFCTHDAATHGPPDATATAADATRGAVTVDVWADRHDPSAPDAPFAVVRVTLERLPGGRAHPAPLWLAWIPADGRLPADLLDLWRWYAARFTIEHGFRFAKQHLGWTTRRSRPPAAADRWTHLLAAGWWQLWLARPLVADTRLPWERPLPPERLTPARVRRAFAGLLPQLGSPARAPKPRGKSPGRQAGQRPPPRDRCPVVRRPHTGGPCRCPSHRSRLRSAA